MELDLKKPETIYKVLKAETANALTNISKLDDKDESFLELKAKVVNFLTTQENKITTNIEELQRNSEWETFTIAFYGETNAGKSTVIETLRILLNEKSKAEEIKAFKKFEKENGINE